MRPAHTPLHPVMTTFGIVGAGHIGSHVARAVIAHGHDVVIANSRGPETLADLTTRKHYPGRHVVEAQVDGRPRPIGAFTLATKSPRGRG